MDNSIVLYVDFIPNLDKIHISSYDCIEPDAAIITHGNFSNDGGIGCDVGIVAKTGCKTPHRKNVGHIFS
jgi:hypothetical protein